nr:MAG: hypothetical protein [Bacteriophage sp.]
MEKDLRLLVGNINQTLKELDYVSYLKKVALSKGKKGEYQSHRLKSNYLKRKLMALKDNLNKKLHGSYIIAQFNLIRGEQKETFEQTFTDLSQKEVEDILQLEAALKQCSLEILEIKEIPTQIRKI